MASKNSEAIMETLKKIYAIKKVGPPKYHLGCDYFQHKSKKGKDKWEIGSCTFVKECIEKVAKILGINLDQ